MKGMLVDDDSSTTARQLCTGKERKYLDGHGTDNLPREKPEADFNRTSFHQIVPNLTHGWNFWRNFPLVILKMLVGVPSDMPTR